MEEETYKIKGIIKRDGTITNFNLDKIINSIYRAATEVGGDNKETSIELSKSIALRLEKDFLNSTPTVDQIQDLVEKALIEEGHAKTAKAYILLRHVKRQERERKALILGGRYGGNLNFSNEALKILERRYLLRDSEGTVIETPKEMLKRVAKNIAHADLSHGATEEVVKETEEKFYQMMAELRFLPNSPTLMNANTKSQQLSSCVVLPIDDSLGGIFDTLKDSAIIHQRGSGTGFSFSRLRPKGDCVGNKGVASGPVSFMYAFDSALEMVKQGGVRPGANMAILRVDHPDIIKFIEAKRNQKYLKNFNISVAVTDRFMRAVEENREYYLTNPRTGRYFGRLRARDVFAVITQNAWKTGDPGLVFIDEINRKHTVKNLGEIESTNQCGEAPLLPYEGCVLGSINLNKFFDESQKDVNWNSLRDTIRTAVHFLDNVIDMNDYPKKEIEQQTKLTRKFGLGIMGFADILCRLKIKYDSEEGLEFGDKLMSFIKSETYEMSSELAEKRGVPLAWKGSDHEKAGRKIRNLTCLSIAPTGTISIITDSSSGCEPIFAVSYQRTVFGDSEFIFLNKIFEKVAKERGFYSLDLLSKISRAGSIQQFKEIPKDVREIFVTTQDISPEWHIRMQSTLQKYVDNSISKTINFPQTASIKDVEDAYLLAWKSKCKGITIYRDGSYEDQVITIGE
jgi:ribonucleoside-diphosphate reductase alpha chain